MAGLVFGLQVLQCLLKRFAFLSLLHLVLCLFCGCCYFLYFGLEFINRLFVHAPLSTAALSMLLNEGRSSVGRSCGNFAFAFYEVCGCSVLSF